MMMQGNGATAAPRDFDQHASARGNAHWSGGAPKLSVLIPFFRHDPSGLIRGLERQLLRAPGDIEIVGLDDGSGDDLLAERVFSSMKKALSPAMLMRLSRNEGRARGRNRLASVARGDWVLFLDSDMLPDSRTFVANYIDIAKASNPPVVVGGFSMNQAPTTPSLALHRAMSLRTECVPARLRRLTPEKYVFTSNLLIRRDVLAATPFDEQFRGWGWEDIEWAMRIARRHRIVHIDNTASHLGLDTAEDLIAKYEQSAPNFAKMVATHLDIVAGYPTFRAARVLRRLPLRRRWSALCRVIATDEQAPLYLREACMRVYRAALYAESV